MRLCKGRQPVNLTEEKKTVKIFRLASFLFAAFTFLMFVPAIQGQRPTEIPWGKQISGLQVRIRECPESERQEGKAMMIFEVRNTSDRPVDFCWWQSPLEKRWTANRFKVTGPDGVVDYQGIMVKRAPPSKKNGDYTTLRSGWTLSVKFDLKEVYRLKAGTKYSMSYEGTSLGSLPASNSIELAIR